MSGKKSSAFSLQQVASLIARGRAALAAGRPKQAEKLLSHGHGLTVEKFGEASVDAAMSGLDLSEALVACGKPLEALALLEASIERCRQSGCDYRIVLRGYRATAVAMWQSGNFSAAEQKFRTLIADLEMKGDDYIIERAEELDHLAQVLAQQERYSEAEPLLVEALAIFEERPERSGNASVCLSALGSLYFRTRRYREAERVNRRALALQEQLVGSDSVDTAMVLDHLAMSLAMRGQSELRRELATEAVVLGERALVILGTNLPNNHSSLAGCRENLRRYRQMAETIAMLGAEQRR